MEPYHPRVRVDMRIIAISEISHSPDLQNSTTFLFLTSVGRFLWRFSCTHCKTVERISQQCVFECGLNLNMNNNAVIPPYKQHNVSFIKFRLCSRLRRWICVNPLPFGLNIVINDPFFVICYDIFEKWVISLPWKKTCRYGYAISLILLAKSKRKLNA